MSHTNIDYTQELEAFNPESGSVFPYLRILHQDGKYLIFEGAIGKDRYRYFMVDENSTGGKACAQYVDKYERRNHVRHQYYEDGQAMLETCRSEALEKAEGGDAYQKYWDTCLSGNDKARLNSYIIPFFDPLTEWFTIKLAVNASQQSTNLKSPLTQKAQQQRWIRGLHKEVVDFIESAKITEARKWSAITMEHAKELLKFRDWLATFLTSPDGHLTIDNFSEDFSHGTAYVEATINSATGRSEIFYVINGRRYPIHLFWIFFKDHHTRLAYAESTDAEKLKILKRLPPQFKILRDKNYETLITKHQLEPSQAEEIMVHANRVIHNIESQIDDMTRFLSEQKGRKSTSAKIRKPGAATIKKILDCIEHAGSIIEQKSLHIGKGEEDIRELFVMHLSTIKGTNTTASGETKNKKGKTDICILNKDSVAIFIGECKIWKGSDQLHAALSQLIDRYIDSNIQRGAILIFVKNKGFKKIRETIQQSILTHSYFASVHGVLEGKHFSIICRRPEDLETTIQVEIMPFPFYDKEQTD